MLTSLALIFLVGLSLAAICQKLRLPRIIGMLITGIILGPFVLNLLDSSILGISAELRKTALVIILIKAGLSLNITDLKKVGRPATMLAFVPASFEIAAYTLFAPMMFGISHIEGGGNRGGAVRCVARCGCAENGKSHRQRYRHAKRHTSDDTCGRVA